MKNILHRDFRSLREDAQAEVRRQAFRNYDSGMKYERIASLAEIHIKTVGQWMLHRKEIEARDCRGKKRGRSPDQQKILSAKEEQKIKETIENKTPDQAGLSFSLWNRKAMRSLIKKESGETIAYQTVSAYAKRWGLTPQRPAKYAAEQNPEAIKKWLEETYPAIEERARKEGAKIHWEDETGVALSTFYARSYAPKGKTPAIKLPARHGTISMISSIENRGDLRFMIYKGALNTDIFLVFLNRLVKDADTKIFLIVDNLRVHKAVRVQKWAKEHEREIELFSPASIRPAIQPR